MLSLRIERRLVESAGSAPASTCLQGRCITCLPRPQKEFRNYDLRFTIWQTASVLPRAGRVLETRPRKLARGLWTKFVNRKSTNRKWTGAAAGNCTRMVAVRKHSTWQEDILLLNHSREIKRAGKLHAPGPCHFNKEQTPLGDLLDPNPRFHGGSFGV